MEKKGSIQLNNKVSFEVKIPGDQWERFKKYFSLCESENWLKDEPRFLNRCSNCNYLGHIGIAYDGYYCPPTNTLLLYHYGGYYVHICESIHIVFPLFHTALHRAKVLGYYKERNWDDGFRGDKIDQFIFDNIKLESTGENRILTIGVDKNGKFIQVAKPEEKVVKHEM